MNSPKTILIVDDSAADRKLIRITLDPHGWQMLEAADGVQALALMAHHPVDLVLTDILMPNMDGFELCRTLRKCDVFRHVRVVVYTSTYNSPGDEKLAFLVGVDKYLTKPSPASLLAQTIAMLLNQSEPPQRQTRPLADDLVIMREYNSVLVKKLEERNLDLGKTQAELLRTNHKLQQRTDELARLNADLERRVAERAAALQRSNDELQRALSQVQELTGLLPICSYCKKVRNDQNYWQQVESYISEHSKAKFNHCVCPECYEQVVKPQLTLELNAAPHPR